jgi:DNA-binding protein H-NS
MALRAALQTLQGKLAVVKRQAGRLNEPGVISLEQFGQVRVFIVPHRVHRTWFQHCKTLNATRIEKENSNAAFAQPTPHFYSRTHALTEETTDGQITTNPTKTRDIPTLRPLDIFIRRTPRNQKNIDSEVESRRAKEVEDLRARVTETAHTLGVSIEELFGLQSIARQRSTRQTKHAKGKQPPKYRGPNGEEWSGKGPSPRWMKPYLAKGKTKQDFLIK